MPCLWRIFEARRLHGGGTLPNDQMAGPRTALRRSLGSCARPEDSNADADFSNESAPPTPLVATPSARAGIELYQNLPFHLPAAKTLSFAASDSSALAHTETGNSGATVWEIGRSDTFPEARGYSGAGRPTLCVSVWEFGLTGTFNAGNGDRHPARGRFMS